MTRFALEIADGSARWNVVAYDGDQPVESWLFSDYEAAKAAKLEWEGEQVPEYPDFSMTEDEERDLRQKLRVIYAQRMVDAFLVACGDRYDYASTISDMVTDLLHYAERAGYNTAAIIDRAVADFEEENKQ